MFLMLGGGLNIIIKGMYLRGEVTPSTASYIYNLHHHNLKCLPRWIYSYVCTLQFELRIQFA